MKSSSLYKIAFLLSLFTLSIANGDIVYGQKLDLRNLSQKALSLGAYGAATYLLYADYLNNPEGFNDHEATAMLLVGIDEYSKAESLLRVIYENKNIKELSDSLRYYYYTCQAYIDHHNNDNINALNNIAKVESSLELTELKADCLVDLGLFNQAIEVYSSLFEDLDESYVNCQIGECYRKCGDYSTAIDYFTRAKQGRPNWAFPYYGIGWSYELSGDDDTALKYYNEGLSVDQSYAYLFLQRGELYDKIGNKEKAAKDFNAVLALDKTIEDGTCRQYALFFLGRNTDALDWMNRVIEFQPNNAGHYYDKACLCCRIGLYDEAIKAIEYAFKNGYRQFAHLNADDDIDPIKSIPAYRELYDKYYAIYQGELEQLKDIL